MKRRSIAVATLIWLVVAFAMAGIVHAVVDDPQVERRITSVVLFPFLLITSAVTHSANAVLPDDGSESAAASLSPSTLNVLLVIAVIIYAVVVAVVINSLSRGLGYLERRREMRLHEN